MYSEAPISFVEELSTPNYLLVIIIEEMVAHSVRIVTFTDECWMNWVVSEALQRTGEWNEKRAGTNR